MTTTRLIALFRITAASAANPKSPISNGSRNSAPPSPIIPPSTPTAAPAPNTSSGRWTRIAVAGPASAVGRNASTRDTLGKSAPRTHRRCGPAQHPS